MRTRTGRTDRKGNLNKRRQETDGKENGLRFVPRKVNKIALHSASVAREMKNVNALLYLLITLDKVY